MRGIPAESPNHYQGDNDGENDPNMVILRRRKAKRGEHTPNLTRPRPSPASLVKSTPYAGAKKTTAELVCCLLKAAAVPKNRRQYAGLKVGFQAPPACGKSGIHGNWCKLSALLSLQHRIDLDGHAPERGQCFNSDSQFFLCSGDVGHVQQLRVLLSCQLRMKCDTQGTIAHEKLQCGFQI
jgi:hypothetical protein